MYRKVVDRGKYKGVYDYWTVKEARAIGIKFKDGRDPKYRRMRLKTGDFIRTEDGYVVPVINATGAWYITPFGWFRRSQIPRVNVPGGGMFSRRLPLREYRIFARWYVRYWDGHLAFRMTFNREPEKGEMERLLKNEAVQDLAINEYEKFMRESGLDPRYVMAQRLRLIERINRILDKIEADGISKGNIEGMRQMLQLLDKSIEGMEDRSLGPVPKEAHERVIWERSGGKLTEAPRAAPVLVEAEDVPISGILPNIEGGEENATEGSEVQSKDDKDGEEDKVGVQGE